jgi:NADPH-dependent glutamate synthase beta subunit-like oxidoreductase/Pyruvate/2-oxoacid:ferredoxin oxidoreductase delta subunit
VVERPAGSENLAQPEKGEDVGYHFTFDRTGCLNCGVCMDVCPVQALDMSRAVTAPIEAGAEALTHPRSAISGKPWMMEFPIQVDECVGCQICVVECPTSVITIAAVPAGEPVTLAPSQGPIIHAPEAQAGWIPLSALTRESLKEAHTDPWGTLQGWRSAKRSESWQSWRAWVTPGEERLLAPCQEACPVGTDAGLYVALIAEGRFEDALAVAAEFNPFPSVCGRVCTAPCEPACRRGVLDEPIAIRELKRYAADHGMAGYPRPPLPSERRPERVAVVGAGPTGLSAAYQLVRAGYGVTIFEAMPVAGGMMALGIPEYRLPKAVLRAEIERIVGLGVELRLNTAMGRDFTFDDLQRQGFAAVLLATGAHKAQPLGIPGEELSGVSPATVFLKTVNLGEPVSLAGDVLVVGGGSTAMDAARSAWRAGARSVRVLYRRTLDDMPAQREELRAAQHEGVIVEPLVAPIEVLGTNGKMTGLRCVRLAVTGRGDDGRATVNPVAGSEFTIEASGLMVAVGEAPDPSILPKGSEVEVAKWGGFVVDPGTLATSRAGVFAAGDVATGPRSIIEGVAQGQRAAWAIDRFLRKLPAARYLPVWRLESSRVATNAVRIDLANRQRGEVPLETVGMANPEGRAREVSLGFDKGSAMTEAARCLRCDVTSASAVVEVKRRVPA